MAVRKASIIEERCTWMSEQLRARWGRSGSLLGELVVKGEVEWWDQQTVGMAATAGSNKLGSE